MTKNKIIEALFTGKNFNDCLAKMEPEHLRDDLKMEVALIVCELPEEKIFELHANNTLEFYVVRIILNLVRSSTSQFYKKFRMPHSELNGHESVDDYDHEERQIREDLQDLAIEEIDKLYWYDAEMIRLYLKLGNFRAIEKQTGIPFISCYKNVRKSLAFIKSKVLTDKPVPVFSKKEMTTINESIKKNL